MPSPASVAYPWRGTPPDAEGYPHYERLRRANDGYRRAYLRLLVERRTDRQRRLRRSPGAARRWSAHLKELRPRFAACLGLALGRPEVSAPCFVRAVPFGPFESATPELATRLWARTYVMTAASWDAEDIELLLISAESDSLAGSARPGVLLIPDSGAALSGAQSPESAARDWGCALASAGFTVAIPRLPAQQRFASTRNKQRLLEGGCVLGEVVFEASRALSGLSRCGSVLPGSCWAVGSGLGGLAAIMLASVDARVGGVVADAPTRWGTVGDGQALIVPRAHAVTDLAELCASIAPRPLALLAAARRAPVSHEAPTTDVRALARSAAPAWALTGAPSRPTLLAPGARARAVAWMASRSLGAAPRSAAVPVRATRPDRRYAVTRFTDGAAWSAAAKRLRRDFRAQMGLPAVNRALAVRRVSQKQLRDYHREEFHIRTGEHTWASVLFMRPAGAIRRRTTILCLPGSGSDVANVERHYAHEVVAEGWNACIIDARVAVYPFFPGAAEERSLIIQSLHDLLACADWVFGREDVDTARVGAMGVSQGGTHSWMLAALEPRIAAAAPICGVSTYRSVIESFRTEWYDSAYISFMDGAHIYYFTPGILALAEQQDVIALIAPRPLSVIGANHDAWFPLHGMRDCARDLRHVYGLLGASNAFDYHEFEGPHDMPEHTRRRAYAFLKKHLDGPRAQGAVVRRRSADR